MKMYSNRVPKKPGYYYGGYIINGKAYLAMRRVILYTVSGLMCEDKLITDYSSCWVWSNRISDPTFEGGVVL
jgi:hypothetical protein